jgi:hypothetical protein
VFAIAPDSKRRCVATPFPSGRAFIRGQHVSRSEYGFIEERRDVRCVERLSEYRSQCHRQKQSEVLDSGTMMQSAFSIERRLRIACILPIPGLAVAITFLASETRLSFPLLAGVGDLLTLSGFLICRCSLFRKADRNV